MPELEWEFIVRWDTWKWWITSNETIENMSNIEITKLIQEWKIIWRIPWEEILLRWFTSVSNNLDDIFIWKWSIQDTLVIITWERWRIRDISDLAMFTNFAEQLWKPPTKFEWIILSDSRARFVSSQFRDVELIDKETLKPYIQRVLEVKINWIE
jgi:hypothetical protein